MERRGKRLVRLCEITFSTYYNEYTQNFRKEISSLDIAAKILSLLANIFSAGKKIKRFYSNNFNNCKIIEKL